MGGIWTHPLTESECRLQVICNFVNPVIIEHMINITAYILTIERGRDSSDQWRKRAISKFLFGNQVDTPKDDNLATYSCFISHSAKDKHFCERLHADLQAKGVRVWYFPEDAKWGETVWGEIDRSINVYDKLVVVCSENSLRSGPVNREIERALKREDTERKGILFPIRIDDYIFDKWEHERKADVVRKVVGDFTGWDKDTAKYDKAFDKLLKGLQAA